MVRCEVSPRVHGVSARIVSDSLACEHDPVVIVVVESFDRMCAVMTAHDDGELRASGIRIPVADAVPVHCALPNRAHSFARSVVTRPRNVVSTWIA